MEAPLISVIVPIYNTEAYLSRALESILAQTHENLEIILVNDGSTDNSPNICNAFAKKDPRIYVIHQENAGVSAARNVGLNAATGDWIGFVDSDDRIDAVMYENLLRAALENNKAISVCGFIKYHLDGWEEINKCDSLSVGLTQTQALECIISGRYFEGFMCNKLYHTSLFKSGRNTRFDENIRFCEDLLLNVQLLLETDGASCVPNALYHYYMHENNASSSFSENRISDITVRKSVLELVSPLSSRLKKLAKFHYANAAIGVLYQACTAGNKTYLKMLKKESRRYLLAFLTSSETNFKMKIRGALIALFPRTSYALWGRLKKRLKISWWHSNTL